MQQEILIQTSSSTYPVFVGEGFMPIEYEGKVLVVSNEKVASLYLDSFLLSLRAKEVYTCILKDGEQYKNMESIEQILHIAFSNRLNRKSLFIALGGGVIGDMVGFASGIFNRGVDFLQVPTTLLAQVDSSVGGKCGVNNIFGKNLIGLFHQPLAVHANINTLKTLEGREFSAGVAEIVKMAICFDKDFFEWLCENDVRESKENLIFAIIKSIGIKNRVVSEDEKEAGLRAALNYGHTFAHVIENITNYSTYLHGECVSMGMCMANRLALKLGNLTCKEEEQILAVLKKYNLPIEFKVMDKDMFYDKFNLDKKAGDKGILFILPNGIGGVEMRSDIAKDMVLEIL